MKRKFIIVLAILLPFCISIIPDSYAGDNNKRMSSVELKALLEKGEKVTLIDVRTEAEYNDGYIPGAINIPLDTIPSLKDAHYKGRIILYCRSGVRSMKAKKMLDEKGIKDVIDLEGGINAWKEIGGRVVRPEKTNKNEGNQEYSPYPKEFIVPKGVCEQGIEPSIVFTTQR